MTRDDLMSIFAPIPGGPARFAITEEDRTDTPQPTEEGTR